MWDAHCAVEDDLSSSLALLLISRPDSRDLLCAGCAQVLEPRSQRSTHDGASGGFFDVEDDRVGSTASAESTAGKTRTHMQYAWRAKSIPTWILCLRIEVSEVA